MRRSHRLVSQVLGAVLILVGCSNHSTAPPRARTLLRTPPNQPIPETGAPVDTGLTIPASSLTPWTGPQTITPTTPGVTNSTLTGYLFTNLVYVTGNITITNSKFVSDSWNHIIIQGTATPGPTFTHIEIDGLNTTTHNDDIGITNSTHDGGNGGNFTIDHSHLYHLNNGARLDSNATMTNTLIDNLSTANGSHTDGIEIYCGNHITIDHTTINATPSNTINSAIIASGGANGFCPISYLTITNNHLIGGIGSLRIDDNQISHVTIANILLTGPFLYFSTDIPYPTEIDTWTNVRLDNGITIPTPQTFGCTTTNSCN